MQEYVFRITQPNIMVKNLDLQGQFEAYQDARRQVRDLRVQAAPGEQATYKLVFAANQLEAEEHLHEQREKPILMEWEK